MKNYKIRLLHEEIKYLHDSLSIMFQHVGMMHNINHVTYYNIRSFIKRLHDRLYHLATVRMIKTNRYVINIDVNQAQSLIDIHTFILDKESMGQYLDNLYIEIFSQIDKQKINDQFINRINIDEYKYQIDFKTKLT